MEKKAWLDLSVGAEVRFIVDKPYMKTKRYQNLGWEDRSEYLHIHVGAQGRIEDELRPEQMYVVSVGPRNDVYVKAGRHDVEYLDSPQAKSRRFEERWKKRADLDKKAYTFDEVWQKKDFPGGISISILINKTVEDGTNSINGMSIWMHDTRGAATDGDLMWNKPGALFYIAQLEYQKLCEETESVINGEKAQDFEKRWKKRAMRKSAMTESSWDEFQSYTDHLSTEAIKFIEKLLDRGVPLEYIGWDGWDEKGYITVEDTHEGLNHFYYPDFTDENVGKLAKAWGRKKRGTPEEWELKWKKRAQRTEYQAFDVGINDYIGEGYRSLGDAVDEQFRIYLDEEQSNTDISAEELQSMEKWSRVEKAIYLNEMNCVFHKDNKEMSHEEVYRELGGGAEQWELKWKKLARRESPFNEGDTVTIRESITPLEVYYEQGDDLPSMMPQREEPLTITKGATAEIVDKAWSVDFKEWIYVIKYSGILFRVPEGVLEGGSRISPEEWEQKWKKKASLTKTAVWSVADRDTGEWMHTGRNSETLEEAVEDMAEYLSTDLEEEDKIIVDRMTIHEKMIWVQEFSYDFVQEQVPEDDYAALPGDIPKRNEEKARKFEERWKKKASGKTFDEQIYAAFKEAWEFFDRARVVPDREDVMYYVNDALVLEENLSYNQIMNAVRREKEKHNEAIKFEERWKKKGSMTKTALWSVWDIQTQEYMETGRNSETKQDAVSDMVEYLLGNEEAEQEEIEAVDHMNSVEMEQYVREYGFEFHEHSDPEVEEKARKFEERWQKKSGRNVLTLYYIVEDGVEREADYDDFVYWHNEFGSKVGSDGILYDKGDLPIGLVDSIYNRHGAEIAWRKFKSGPTPEEWEARWQKKSVVTAEFKNQTLQTSDVPEELVAQIKGIQQTIPKDILLTEEDERGWIEGGLQKLFHMTVLYGVEAKDEEKIKEIVKEAVAEGIEAETGEVEYFDNKKEGKEPQTCMVLRVKSEGLRKLHDTLKAEVANKDSYPEYKAHVAIAYIKHKERLPEVEIQPVKWRVKAIEMSQKDGDLKKVSRLTQAFGSTQLWISPQGKEFNVSGVGHWGWMFDDKNAKMLKKDYKIDVYKALKDMEAGKSITGEGEEIMLVNGWVRMSGHGSFEVWDINDYATKNIIEDYFLKYPNSELYIDFFQPKRDSVRITLEELGEHGLGDAVRQSMRFKSIYGSAFLDPGDEEAIKQIVREGGGGDPIKVVEYMDVDMGIVVFFQDNNMSTVAMPLEDISVENVQGKMREKDEERERVTKTASSEFGSAWITPDGKVHENLYCHMDWVDNNWDKLEKYGLDLGKWVDNDDEDLGFELVRLGFAQINNHRDSNEIFVLVNRLPLTDSVKDYIESNKPANIRIQTLNPKRGNYVSYDEYLERYAGATGVMKTASDDNGKHIWVIQKHKSTGKAGLHWDLRLEVDV